jgi:hypothetical protein
MPTEDRRCPVAPIRLERIIDAARGFWAASVAGRQVVVGDHYQDGQLGVYLPPGAILPEVILREMWLWNDALGKGRLAGKRGDRVTARTIAGRRSDGLFYGSQGRHFDHAWPVGQDAAPAWGVTFAPEDRHARVG